MVITQDSVRKKLIEKCEGLKVQYIAKQVGIPVDIVSKFKNNRRELWEESLIKLNAFLDLCKDFEIRELVRTGVTGLTRGVCR